MRRLGVLLLLTIGVGSGVAYAATLSVSSWSLFAGSQALTKGTCTVTGALDTYVDQSNAGQSFGTSTFLGTRSNTGSKAWTFVKFDLSSCSLPTTAGADSATLSLRLTMAPGSSRTLTVTPVLSSWGNTLTWTQAQSLSYGSTTTTFTTGTTSNVTRTATVTVDVDDLIKSPSANYGWRIQDNGGGSFTSVFASSDSASNKPQLVINYAT
jgi:hypothetical protein